MRITSPRCLGLDLHNKQITGHLRVQESSGKEPSGVDVRFGTTPEQLLRLRQWVIDQHVANVVMESTSVYWMHVYEVLEQVTAAVVVNAAHVKKVPGRKTDVSDAEWLADLHAHGLLRPSFVPPREIREMRTLTRYRTTLVAMRTAAKNRTIKVIEMSGLKLSSVVCDSFGVTGRALLNAVARGEADTLEVEQVAKGSLRHKVAELSAVLRGAPLNAHHRELLAMHLLAYDAIDARLAEVEARIVERSKPYVRQIEKLDAVPGINPLAAITVVAETGVDMSAYRSADHLTALAGLAPGNDISDQKRRRISVRKGNRYLKRICVQIAWAAARKKDSFFRARFLRLQHRIGTNKAIVATARQILIVVFHLLSGDRPYQDLGPHLYDRRDKARLIRRHLDGLKRLGVTIDLKAAI